MTDYRIENVKENFQMTSLGVILGDFNDWEGNGKKIAARKAEITSNGALTELTSKADDTQDYVVNYVFDGKPYRGFAVMGNVDMPDTDKLDFLAGDYIVLTMTGNDKDTLADQLTGKAFGGALQEITDYKYVGPGNSTFVKEQADGTFLAEMWLRAEKA
ncbi:MAG: hypothetical protein FWF42_00775 [Streptococcaceae bacterium]|nr:hypothetical protein [Streptococcaceae bacterium]MCL2681592.1 hypothetical protein [Streptococcaceae bacterium]MCL2858202.1 hypothetical protein [Streptococcaceae bacterium]